MLVCLNDVPLIIGNLNAITMVLWWFIQTRLKITLEERKFNIVIFDPGKRVLSVNFSLNLFWWQALYRISKIKDPPFESRILTGSNLWNLTYLIDRTWRGHLWNLNHLMLRCEPFIEGQKMVIFINFMLMSAICVNVFRSWNLCQWIVCL